MKTLKNKIIWTKMSGAGNSFWITHFLDTTNLINKNWSEIAQTLCQENNKPKADGLAILLPSNTCDLKWLFYNADGSPAEMCGNAACCVTDYIFKKKLLPCKQHSLILETAAQNIKGELKKGRAHIFLKQSETTQGPFKEIFNKDEKVSYFFINSSVPHAVIKLCTWPSTSTKWENKKNIAKILRKKTTHHKNGMNISFYHPQNNNQLLARSFERGVEDFTPACGTGALAVAQIHRQQQTHLQLIFVQMPGGKLEIGFHSDRTVSLMSPVKWLQEIEER